MAKIGEIRPAVIRWKCATAGRNLRLSIGASQTSAGRGSAQNVSSGRFLGVFHAVQAACNDNTTEAVMTRAHKGRRGRNSWPVDPRQMDMLALLEGAIALPEPEAPKAGARDCDQQTRHLLNEAIKAGPFNSRDDLAEAVSFHSGRRITKAMIDSWTGASRPHALPANLVPAFCAALGNTILLQGLAEASGCALTEGAELVRQRLDRLTLFIRLARAEQRRLTAATPLFREVGHD